MVSTAPSTNHSLMSMRLLRLIVLLFLTVALLPFTSPPTTTVAAGQTQFVASGHVPAGLSSNDWATIQAQLVGPTYLKASNTGALDYFGYSVAIDGNTVVVGTYAEDGNDTYVEDSGAAYVFVHDGTAWAQQAYLKASNPGAEDRFGLSVAISGDTIVVGAPREDSNGIDGEADNSLENSGAAYVFTRSGTIWTKQAYLKASNPGAEDQFGIRVAISGDTIVVGALLEDSIGPGLEADNSLPDSGAAYVFTRSGTTWTQQAYLKASNPGENDQFGSRVAVDGDTIVVGAWLEDSSGSPSDNSLPDSGAVYVFTRSGIAWAQQAYRKASSPDAHDQFGSSVAIDGDTIVVGAWFEDSKGSNPEDDTLTDSGAAYVFTRSGTDWMPQAYLKASNPDMKDYLGYSVAIDGDTIVVGSDSEDSSNNSLTDSGAAYVFMRNGTTWTQQTYLKASNPGAYDSFGWSVTISGGTIVVGTPHEDSQAAGVDGNGADNSIANSGAAYIFVPASATVYLPLVVR